MAGNINVTGLFYDVLIVSAFVGQAKCEILLNSTLSNEATAYHGDTVYFYCRTVGSGALAWRSNEYIGRNGEQLSLSLPGSTSNLSSFAVATLDSRYTENGQTVLESTLAIIVQGSILSASITCYSLGTDESNTTSFHLAENPSISYGNPIVCPGDIRTFTCETRDSNTLAWESEQYIGAGGLRLSFFSFGSQPGDIIESVINLNISARLIRNYEINGVRVLRSELNIVVSQDISGDICHSVTCANIDLDTEKNFTLKLAPDGTCGFAVPTESGTTMQTVNTNPNGVRNSDGNDSEISHIIAGAIVGGVAVLTLVFAASLIIYFVSKKENPCCAVQKEEDA